MENLPHFFWAPEISALIDMQNRRFWGGFEFLMKPLKSMGLANQLENGRKISSLSLKNAQFLNFSNLKYFIQLHI